MTVFVLGKTSKSRHENCAPEAKTQIFVYINYFFFFNFKININIFFSPLNHLWLILWNFNRLPLTLAVWSLMFASTFLVFAGLKYWSLVPAKAITLRSEAPWLFVLTGYFIAFFYLSLKFLFNAELPCACSFIITCENVGFRFERFFKSFRKFCFI